MGLKVTTETDHYSSKLFDQLSVCLHPDRKTRTQIHTQTHTHLRAEAQNIPHPRVTPPFAPTAKIEPHRHEQPMLGFKPFHHS